MRISFNKTFMFVICISITICLNVFSENVWDIDIPIPNKDPLWENVGKLWENHWDKKNIKELIETLHQLETSHSDRIETHLWLARVYYLKARYDNDDREKNFKQSEKYAATALSMDTGNIIAVKLLYSSAVSHSDSSYIEKTYGDVIRKALPLKTGRALAVMDTVPEFMTSLPEWDQRENIENAIKSVTLFKKIADASPDNTLAQLWASRGCYYLGYYYLSLDQSDKSLPFFVEGRTYGEKALKLSPHSVPAHYWTQLNLSRSIEHANILVKARYLTPIMFHLVFVANENMTYFYGAPINSISTILEKGKWVAEKGMGMAGYSTDMVKTATDLSVIIFPTYFYTHFAKAEVYYHNGEKNKAKDILYEILDMDPYINPHHAAENICVQRLVKKYLKKNFGETAISTERKKVSND